MTDEQKIIADEIVNCFKENGGLTKTDERVLSIMQNKGYNYNITRYVLAMLVSKKILAKDINQVATTYFLTDAGWLYESYNKLLEDEAQRKELENSQIISGIKANNASFYNAGATILFGLIVTTTTLFTCKREANRDTRELYKQEQDSLKELRQARHDSLYEKFLLRKVQETAGNSINAKK